MKLAKKKVIFGIGSQKRNMATYLMEHDENIIAVVDNDEEKQGKTINRGYKVQAVDILDKYKELDDVIIIITAHSAHTQIKKQLIDLGWDEERIIVAITDIPFFSSFEYKCYLSEIELKNPIPTLLNIELSGFCNCKCIYCPFHGEVNLKENHKGFMNEETMKAVINQVKKIPTIRAVDTTGPGEIFINTKWFELLQMLLDETNIEEVYMYTNGMLLTEDNIKKITMLHAKRIQVEVSIDGMNPTENDTYRIGAKYEEIRKNVYAAKKIFDQYNIQMIITNCYPGDIREIQKANNTINSKENTVPEYLKRDFPDIRIVSQITFFYGYDVELSKFSKVAVRWKDKESRCMNLFYRIAVDYAGNLLRCSCGHAGIEAIGDVFHNDVLEIWKKNKEMNEARDNFIKGTEQSDFCEGCPGKGLGKYYVLVRK